MDHKLVVLGVAAALSSAAVVRARQPAPPANVPPPIATEWRLPFAPPQGRPLRYRISTDYEGPTAPADSTTEQTLTFGTLPGGDLEMMMVTHTITVAGKTYTPTSELHEFPQMGDVALLLSPIRFRLTPQGAIKRIENWDEYRKNLELLPAIAFAGADTEFERQTVRLAMERNTFPQPNPEAAAMASAPLWRQLFGYGSTMVVPGQRRTWTTEQPFLEGAAKLVRTTELTVTPLADGHARVERTQVIDPVGFAAAAAPGWELNPQLGMAEAARLRINVDWLKDITDTTTTSFLIDQNGTILEGTLTRRGVKDATRRG